MRTVTVPIDIIYSGYFVHSINPKLVEPIHVSELSDR